MVALYPSLSNRNVHMNRGCCYNAGSDPAGLGQGLKFYTHEKLTDNGDAAGLRTSITSSKDFYSIFYHKVDMKRDLLYLTC